MTRHSYNLKEKIAITDLLRAHCSVMADGLVRYEEGWNDDKIAREASRVIDRHVGTQSIKRTRNNLLGQLEHRGNGLVQKRSTASTIAIIKAISATDDRVDALEAAMDVLWNGLGMKAKWREF